MKTCITAASAAALSIGLLTDMPAVADLVLLQHR